MEGLTEVQRVGRVVPGTATTPARPADPGAGAQESKRLRPGRRLTSATSSESGARLLSLRSRAAMWAGLGIGVAVYLVFGIAPAVGNLVVSFTNYSGLPGSATSFAGLRNYTALATSQRPGFVAGVIATALFVVGVTVVQNVVALLLAHRLQGTGKVAALLRMAVFLPIVLGVTVVGLIWLLIFNPAGGPAASFFGDFGVQSAYFGGSSSALPLVIMVQIWQNLGFTMLVFIGGLRAIPPDLYEAADIDGVTAWQRLRSITVPLLAPAVTVNVLLAVVGSFTLYNLIYVLTGGLHGTNTLGMLAFTAAFGTSADLGYGAAVSIALFVMTFIVALPLLAWLRTRERRVLA
ncbi:MAG: carbohydrate ABC transporter permease [Acidimicrobiales bacterium]